MAIIARQRQIFEWQELEILGDLERLRKVAAGFKIPAR